MDWGKIHRYKELKGDNKQKRESEMEKPESLSHSLAWSCGGGGRIYSVRNCQHLWLMCSLPQGNLSSFSAPNPPIYPFIQSAGRPVTQASFYLSSHSPIRPGKQVQPPIHKMASPETLIDFSSIHPCIHPSCRKLSFMVLTVSLDLTLTIPWLLRHSDPGIS